MTSSPQHLWWHTLPAVNATLNGVSALFLVAAFVMVKQRKFVAHATLIICALLTSAAFLTCYVLLHYMKMKNGEMVTRFPLSPWRPWYLALLTSHTILAVVILPLIVFSLAFAWGRKWIAHHKISVVTFPLWLYVSVTGVLVYLMLYQLAPRL